MDEQKGSFADDGIRIGVPQFPPKQLPENSKLRHNRFP